MKFLSRKLLAFTLVATLLTGCNDATNVAESNVSTANVTSAMGEANVVDVSIEKMRIVTTTFAEYDWVREILGERIADVELTLLLDNGVDLHSYNPSVDDIINIGNSNLFIYNGGESTDIWTDDVISQAKNQNLVSINLLEEMGDLAIEAEHDEDCTDENCEIDHSAEEHDHAHDEECDDPDCEIDHSAEEHDHDHDEECDDPDCEIDHSAEEHDHDHDEECDDLDCEIDHSAEEHDHDHDEECDDPDCEIDHSAEGHDHDHDHGTHDDEHFWLSLNNAQLLCTKIAKEIIAIDPANADIYNANLDAYIEKLDNLDKEYKNMVSSAERNVLVIADRNPFMYLINDYGLEYYAAFSGCTAETEASFETITMLTQKVNEFDLECVVTTETGHKIAETVVSSSDKKDQETYVLDSIQSTSSNTTDTYLSIMESNLEVLTKVLN